MRTCAVVRKVVLTVWLSFIMPWAIVVPLPWLGMLKALAVVMGKCTDLLLCHIPFHSEGRVFGRTGGFSTRWLKGCSVQSQRSICPRALAKHALGGHIHPIQCTLNIQTYSSGSKEFMTSNGWKTIVCLCVRPEEWFTDSRHNVRHLAGLCEVSFSLQWMFSPTGYWTCCSLCSAAGSTKDATVIIGSYHRT